MNRRIAAVLALVLLLAAGTALAAGPKDRDQVEFEQEITLAQAPAAVRATIAREAGEHELLELERVRKGRALWYEAEWLEDGMEVEIRVDPAGELLAREVEDPDVPDADEDD